MVKISVIVPVFNVEEYICKCIESIINQSYHNLEIILVDDGSTDRSGIICDEYKKKDERIIVIHKENGGLVSARKVGVEYATGEYISYVDSDDWIEKDMYQKIEQQIRDCYPDIVIFGFIKEYDGWIDYYKEQLKPGFYTSNQFYELYNEYLKINNYFYLPIIKQHVWAKLIKSSYLKCAQEEVDNRICIGEDCVSYACLFRANTILLLDECLYHYCVRDKSIMHKNESAEYETYLILIRYLKNIFTSKKELYSWLIEIVYYYLILMAPQKVFMLKDDEMNIFPRLKRKNKIVIYGKGVIGKKIYTLFEDTSYCKIINWIDSYEIGEINRLNPQEYDFVLIAVGLGEAVKKIEKKLIKENVPKEKILKIERKNLLKIDLPEEVIMIINQECN